MNTKQSNRFMLLLMANQVVMIFVISLFFREQLLALPDWAGIVVSQMLMFLVPCAVVAVGFRGQLSELFPFRNIGATNAIMIIGICLLIQPFMMLVSYFSTLFADNYIAELVEGMIYDGGLLLTLGIIAVVPSVFEELACRGPALSGYRKSTVITAVVINGIFFGMMHMNLHQFFYTAILGGVFALLMLYTRSLLAPMLGHFVLNGSQSALMAFALWAEENLPVPEYTAEYAAEMPEIAVVFTMLFLVVLTLPFAVWILVSFVKRNSRVVVDEAQRTAPPTSGDEIGDRPMADDVVEEEAPRSSWKDVFTWELALVVALYGGMMLLLYFPVP